MRPNVNFRTDPPQTPRTLGAAFGAVPWMPSGSDRPVIFRRRLHNVGRGSCRRLQKLTGAHRRGSVLISRRGGSESDQDQRGEGKGCAGGVEADPGPVPRLEVEGSLAKDLRRVEGSTLDEEEPVEGPKIENGC